MKITKYKTSKYLTITAGIVSGMLFAYSAMTAMYPARVVGKEWQDKIVETCRSLKGHCEKVSFEKAWVNGHWLGVQVNATALPNHVDAVQGALDAAVGEAARKYVTLTVTQPPIRPSKKS